MLKYTGLKNKFANVSKHLTEELEIIVLDTVNLVVCCIIS